jgi:hypothetical protein
MKTRIGAAVAAAVCLGLSASPSASAAGQGIVGPNEHTPYNMGYCAPLLGGGGLGVRPWINQVLVDPGVRSPGDLYKQRAANPDDRQCVARTG